MDDVLFVRGFEGSVKVLDFGLAQRWTADLKVATKTA